MTTFSFFWFYLTGVAVLVFDFSFSDVCLLGQFVGIFEGPGIAEICIMGSKTQFEVELKFREFSAIELLT
jgi:hypothetical protein